MAEQAPTAEIENGKPQRSSEFMLRAEVMQESTLSKTVIWRLMNRGEFPLPVRLSPNRVAWVRSEVEAWKEARKRDRVSEQQAA
jgi:prophage regulatory protein